jgi:ATP-binding cassette subfamily F protein 3
VQLKEFRGGLIVVSHDQHFISQVCRDIYVVGDQKVARFPGSFEDYKKLTLANQLAAAGSRK